MIDAPLALAFTAGLVATVNPCGFAMLPAYLAWFVGVAGTDAAPSAAARVARALAVSGLMSLTFLVTFGVAGVLVTVGALLVIDVVPWLAIVVGLGLAAAGVAMLRGWRPIVALPQRSKGIGSRGWRSVMLFGLSYAVASLSCTLPVFLAAVPSPSPSAGSCSPPSGSPLGDGPATTRPRRRSRRGAGQPAVGPAPPRTAARPRPAGLRASRSRARPVGGSPRSILPMTSSRRTTNALPWATIHRRRAGCTCRA